MLTYLLPLVLLTAYAGWLVRRAVLDDGKPVSALEVVASGVFLLVVGGISETSLSVQLVLLAVAAGLTGWLLWSRRYRQLPIVLLAGLLATIISAVIVVAAPGNYIHEARLTGSVHGWSQVPAALQASVDFVGLFVRTVEFRARSAVAILFFLSLSFGLCSFFSRLSPPLGGQGDGGWGERIDPTSAGTSSPVSTTRGWRLELAGILGAVACGWVLLIAAAIPGYFAQEWDPPERAQFVGVWVAAVALPIAAYLLGRLLARAARHPWLMPFAGPAALVWGVCLLVLSVGPLLDLRGTLALASSDAGYAAAWDALDATIRGQAVDGQPVVVNATLPSHFGFDFIVDDPGAYPNPCVAQFYGVPLIRSTGD